MGLHCFHRPVQGLGYHCPCHHPGGHCRLYRRGDRAASLVCLDNHLHSFLGRGYMRGLLIVPRRVRDSGWPAGDGSRHQVSTEDDGDIPEKRGAWADNALPVAAAGGAASTSTASGRRAGAAATDGVKRGTVRRTAGRGTACGAGWYAVMFCSQCGNKIGADAAFCPKCGNRVR